MNCECFAELTDIMPQIADEHCGGELVLIPEGGYHLESLAHGTRAVLKIMACGEAPEPQESGLAEVETARRFHEEAFREE